MPIHIHIEHLILENTPFARSDSAAFHTALERELSVLASAANTDEWSPARRTSLQANAISPPQPNISTWAAASAQSLFAAVTSPAR
jgi:hypothetical protein